MSNFIEMKFKNGYGIINIEEIEYVHVLGNGDVMAKCKLESEPVKQPYNFYGRFSSVKEDKKIYIPNHMNKK